MFVLQVVIDGPFQQLFPESLLEEMAFVVKRAGRPNVSFDYEEVNFYNHRSKVLKRIEYQPITIGFYDDMNSNVLSFLERYLAVTSPISRLGDKGQVYKLFEESGMNSPNDFASASTDGFARVPGVTDTDTSIISYINLFHIYNGGSLVDQYTFAKPKITEIQLDDVDMTMSGDGTEAAFTFSYEALGIQTRIRAAELRNRIQDYTDAGLHTLNLPRSLNTPLSTGGVFGAAGPGDVIRETARDIASDALSGAALGGAIGGAIGGVGGAIQAGVGTATNVVGNAVSDLLGIGGDDQANSDNFD
jgi:hypothetical protein